MKVLIVLLFLLISNINFSQNWISPGQTWFFVGPMIHFNFGGGEHHLSLALEGSYWRYAFTNPNAPFIGADAGIEYEFGGKFRVYGEGQVGGILGLSAGPVLEFEDGNSRLGIQSSLWFCFIAGVDMRWRYTDVNYWSPGVFGKIPIHN
jgi:hypothetical protein